MFPSDQSCRILVTAGPTHEPIDAVRYLGNRSSGRMGMALAEAARRRGNRVTLLLGPTIPAPSSAFWSEKRVKQPIPDGNQPLPEDQLPAGAVSAGKSPEAGRADSRRGSEPAFHDSTGQWQRFQSTADLQHLLSAEFPRHDLLIMAAAVADYRPLGGEVSGKLPRDAAPRQITLEATPDLVAELARSARPDQLLIGFALEEPDQLATRAQAKLIRKGLHAIVANPLATMDATRITATLFLPDAPPLLPPSDLAKVDFAEWLLDQLPAIRRAAKSR